MVGGHMWGLGVGFVSMVGGHMWVCGYMWRLGGGYLGVYEQPKSAALQCGNELGPRAGRYSKTSRFLYCLLRCQGCDAGRLEFLDYY